MKHLQEFTSLGFINNANNFIFCPYCHAQALRISIALIGVAGGIGGYPSAMLELFFAQQRHE